MARKSRKRSNIDSICKPSRDTVGYIRLSLRDKDSSGSVENQKLIIGEWGRQHQTPIMHYYIENGFSGKRFGRPAFQKMLQDIHQSKIDCVVVKDGCVILEAKEVLIQATEDKATYEKQYVKFRKFLSVISKDIPLSEIVDCIDKIVVDYGGKNVVKWHI